MGLIILLTVLGGLDSSARAVCGDCGTLRMRSLLYEVPLPFSFIEPGEVTELVYRAYPEACPHQWLPVEENRHPCGNVFWDGDFLQASWLEAHGILSQASAVDPKGAADLIRWLHRNEVELARWDPLLQERGIRSEEADLIKALPFAGADEFRDWSARLTADGN